MNSADFEIIEQALDGFQCVPDWLPGGHKRGNEWVVANPNRNDRNPGSFSVNMLTGVWKDYAISKGGSDKISLYAYLFCNEEQGAAAKELAANKGIKLGDPVDRERAMVAKADNVQQIEEAKPKIIMPVPFAAPNPVFEHPSMGKPTTTWAYRDGDGEVLLYVCRFDPADGSRKQVVPRSWCHDPKDGKQKWMWRGISGKDKRPLYGLDKLAANPDANVVMVEGEKATDAAQELFGEAVVTMSWLGGVASAPLAALKPLEGRCVILWPDFDSATYNDSHPKAGEVMPLHEQPGFIAMMTHAAALKGVAREIIMVGYKPGGDFPHGWDLADALADGWDQGRVGEYMVTHSGDPLHTAAAKPPTPPKPPAANPPPGDDAEPEDEPPNLSLDANVNPFGWAHMTDKMQPLNTAENLEFMLNEYGIKARYNEVRKTTEVSLPGRTYSADNRANCSLAEITSMAARNRMPQGMLADYIKLLADKNAYNPVKDWITSKPWDGVTRLPDLFATITVQDQTRELTNKLIFRWLVSAVAAAFMPTGFEAHGVLVFTGAQGEGKTRWVKRLLPQSMQDVILAGAVLDPSNKDTVTNAISHWLVELGELDATFRKADIARLKSFITNAVDKVRRPYDRVESDYQRRTVFFASVNEDKYLVDDTGNRRWWTVAVQAVNYLHEIDVQQLWAEVLSIWQAGEQHWLSDDEFKALNELNAEHESVDPVEEMILGAFDWNQLAGLGCREMTASDVLAAIGYDKPNKAGATHASKVLKKLTKGEPLKRNSGRYFKMPPMFKKRDDMGGRFAHSDESRPF